MGKRLFRTTLSLWVCITFLQAPASWADRVVDNFESYPNGKIVGPTATSIPWRRFGGATNDNVVVTSHERWVLTGGSSAIYCLTWPSSFGAVRYVFGKETNLADHDRVTFKMRSDRSNTGTRVRLAISNGNTTFVSFEDRSISKQKQLITFYLGPKHLGRSTGEGTYNEVIRGAWTIGFDFRNVETNGYETVVFDDITLTTPDRDPKISTRD